MASSCSSPWSPWASLSASSNSIRTLIIAVWTHAGRKMPPCLASQISCLEYNREVTRSSVRIHEVTGVVCPITFVVIRFKSPPTKLSTGPLEIVQCCQRASFQSAILGKRIERRCRVTHREKTWVWILVATTTACWGQSWTFCGGVERWVVFR